MFIGVKWIIATWSRISINTDVIFTQHAMDYATMRMRHLDRMLWYLRLGSWVQTIQNDEQRRFYLVW